MFESLKNLFYAKPLQAKRRRTDQRLEFCSLEARQMLATVVPEVHGSGDNTYLIVKVYGTGGDDNIELRSEANSDKAVYDNGALIWSSSDNVNRFEVFTYNGNDYTANLGDFWVKFYGGNGNDTYHGGDNTDFAYGGTGDDELIGGDGRDELWGGTGTDRLLGQSGTDTLRGGVDRDLIYGGDDADRIYGDDGNDHLVGGDGYDDIWGGDGIDRIYGGDGYDDIYGGNGNDRISGGEGYDEIYGDGGHDIINGDAGYDNIWGGLGNDTIRGASGYDEIHGDEGNDWIDGGSGHDQIHGGDGTDRLFGSHDYDQLFGGAGNDFIDGGDGIDDLYGGLGNDTMFGGGGSDDLFGNEGEDYINGGAGNDFIDGGDGNDNLIGGGGQGEVILGGDGDDSIRSQASAKLLARGGAGNDRIVGSNADDQIYGDEGDDIISAGLGDDFIFDDEGFNRIFGGRGFDSIFNSAGFSRGDEGADRLIDLGTTQKLIDHAPEDIIVKVFIDDWDQGKARFLDLALKQYVNEVDSNILLRANPDDSSLVIRQVDSLPNGRQVANVDGEIHVTSWDSGLVLADNVWSGGYGNANAEVLHQEFHLSMGQNWNSDAKLVAFHSSLAGRFDEFMALSSWTDVDPQDPTFSESVEGSWWYKTDAEFVDPSGRLNPETDFATVWASQFSSYGEQVQEKSSWMQALFAEMSSLGGS